VASVACIGAGIVAAAQIGWFFLSSSIRGAALIHRERQAIIAAGRDTRACRNPVGNLHRAPASGSTPKGLLEVPALGLVAPVLQGTGDAVLSEAVGHVPASVWPGQQGTTVLAAHDITWFSRIDRLRPGDAIRYATPCHTFAYRVTSHRIVQAGYPVYDTATPRIVLDTCYPVNALYLTSRRYLVYADLVAASSASPVPAPPSSLPPLTVPAPKALIAQGLGLEQNYAPLGTLSLADSPSPGWRQTSAPLKAEATALTAYFGLLRSAEQGQRGWWADLAPAVPAAAADGIWGGEVTGYDTRLDITLRVRGSQVIGARLTAAIAVAGSLRPGTYDLAVTENVAAQGRLTVSGFMLRAVG
jgi:sortase A